MTDAQAERVRALVDEASGEGVELIRSHDEPGSDYLVPTVVLGVDRGRRIVREEVFGPVTAVLPAATVDEAIAAANDFELRARRRRRLRR